MANPYPENTQYIDKYGPSALPNITKSVKDSVKVPVYAPPAPTVDISGLYKNMVSFPAEKAVSPRTDAKIESVPKGYNEFLQGQKNPQGENMWVTPSDKTYIRNWPDNLGGGQYAVDPTQPGEIVKSSRATNPKETILLRGGLSPYDAQIDHIIPLNMGGIDTLTNKQVLSTAEHEQKTKAQGVALTLLAQGKIDTQQAKMMTLNWKDFDVTGVPMPDAFGYVTNLSPEKAKKLTSGSKDEYYKMLGMDNKAEKVNKQWEKDLIHPPGTYGHSLGDSIKAVWKEIPDSLNKVLGNSVLGNLGKGLVEGATGGIISAAPDEGDKGFAKVSARIAGNALGMFIPMGLFAKGLGLAGRVLGEIPMLSKLFGAPTAIVKALPWTAGAAEGSRAVMATEAAFENPSLISKALSKTKGMLSKVNNFGKAATVAEDASQAGSRLLQAQDIPMELNKTGLARLKYGDKINKALFFGSYSVATKLTRDGLTERDEGDFYDYAKDFVTNALTGSVLSSAGQNWKGYASLGATALTLGAINGDSMEDNLASAVTMVGLHGMGSAKAQRMGLTKDIRGKDGPLRPSINHVEELNSQMNKVADQMAMEVVSKYAPNEGANVSSSNLHPEIGTKRGVFGSQELARAKQEAFTNMMRQSQEENWSPQQIEAETNKIVASIRQLDKGNMGVLIREKADIADIKSVAQKLASKTDVRTIDNGTVPQKVHDLYGGSLPRPLPPVDFNEKPSGDFSVTGPIPVTGYGSTINGGEKRSNLMRWREAFAAGKATDDVYFTDRGADYLKQRELQNETLKGTKTGTGKDYVPHAHPENTVEAYVKIQLPNGDWDFLPIGYQARAHRMVDMNDAVGSELIKYPLENHKDNMSDAMRKNGVSVVTGKIMPLLTDPIPGGIRIQKGSGPQEFHVRAFVNDARWRDAIKTEQEYKTQSSEIPKQGEPVVGSGTQPTQQALPLATKISETVKKPSETPKTEVVKTTEKSKENIPKTLPVEKITPKAIAEAPAVPETPSPVVTSRPGWREFVLMGRGKEGVNSGAVHYLKNPEATSEFTRKNLTKIAKEVSTNGEDIQGGWPKYLSAVTEKIQKANNDPSFKITNKKELRDLEWSFKHLANSGARKEFVTGKDNSEASLKTGTLDNVGQTDKLIKEYNKANGLPEDAMEVVSINRNNTYDGVKNAIDSRSKFDFNVEKLKNIDGKEYIPMGITAKGADNVVFVRTEPKLIEAFDKNPERYLNEGEKLTTPQDKFMRVFAVDVLNMPKDISSGDFVKRANLIYHRYDQYSGPDANAKVKIHILPAKKIGSEKDLVPSSSKFEDPKDPNVQKTIDSFTSGSSIDGKFIIGEKLYDKLVNDFNYDPSKFETGFKPLVSGNIEKDGQLIKMIQKGHAIKADPALREMLKSEYGLELGSGEIASFDTNAKVGPKNGTHEISLSSIYAKPLGTGEEGRIKSSFERKLMDSDPKATEDIIKQTNERKKDFEAFNEELMASKNKEELDAVITKFADRYNLDKDTLFYGPLGESYSLGAAKINLSHNLEKISKNMFVETVLSDTIPNSGRAFMSPSIKLKLDGPNKPARYVNDNEAVLGSEFMKKNNLKDGDEVMILRDPSYDINNVVIAKAINGSKLGHESLGKEHAIVSHFNERIKLQGDQDGDKVLVVKVGEGGVPESYAKAVNTRGAKATPFTEVNQTKPVYATTESVKNTIKDQLVGDDQTSRISVVNRVMDTVVNNGITVKVHPAPFGSQSKYEVFSNGKLVESGETARAGTGFTASPKWGAEERQLRSQALQEALDSKKSKDIVNRTENNNPSWMMKQAFVDESGKKINDFQARAVSGALKNIQKPFDLQKISENSNSLDGVLKELEPSFKVFRNIKESGGSLTPLQEKLLSLSDVKNFKVPQEVITAADKLGSNAVKEQIKGINERNPKLAEIRKLALKAKNEYLKQGVSAAVKKSVKNKVDDFFLNNLEEGKYTPGDLTDIAYWASTSKEGNIKHGPTFPTAKYVFRYNNMINASPEVAKTYYQGSESYGDTTKKGPKDFQSLSSSTRK